MSLSTSQLNNLTSLFTPQAVTDPLSNTLEKFNHYFSKLDQYKVGTAITLLLQHDPTISLQPEYRFLSILFMLELYNEKKSADGNIIDHPFLALIRRLLRRENSFKLQDNILNQTEMKDNENGNHLNNSNNGGNSNFDPGKLKTVNNQGQLSNQTIQFFNHQLRNNFNNLPPASQKDLINLNNMKNQQTTVAGNSLNSSNIYQFIPDYLRGLSFSRELSIAGS